MGYNFPGFLYDPALKPSTESQPIHEDSVMGKIHSNYGLSTLVTHLGEGKNPHLAHVMPIYQTSTFDFENVQSGVRTSRNAKNRDICTRVRLSETWHTLPEKSLTLKGCNLSAARIKIGQGRDCWLGGFCLRDGSHQQRGPEPGYGRGYHHQPERPVQRNLSFYRSISPQGIKSMWCGWITPHQKRGKMPSGNTPMRKLPTPRHPSIPPWQWWT